MNSNLAFQDDYIREELINGQVVSMSPQPSINHITIISNINTIFHNFRKGLFYSGFYRGMRP